MSNHKQTLYKQCLLQRRNERQMSFIPEEYAIEMEYVKLKEGEKWEDGWQVLTAYGPSVTWESIQTNAQQARDTRKASDI